MSDSFIIKNIDIWKADSEEGLVCGVLGCTQKLTYRCKVCGNHYCDEHVKIHFHPVDEVKKANIKGNILVRSCSDTPTEVKK